MSDPMKPKAPATPKPPKGFSEALGLRRLQSFHGTKTMSTQHTPSPAAIRAAEAFFFEQTNFPLTRERTRPLALLIDRAIAEAQREATTKLPQLEAVKLAAQKLLEHRRGTLNTGLGYIPDNDTTRTLIEQLAAKLTAVGDGRDGKTP